MSKTPLRMHRSSIDRKGRANNGNTPTTCLPFIYVDRECLCSRLTTIAWNKSQLRRINHNLIVVVRCSMDVITGD